MGYMVTRSDSRNNSIERFTELKVLVTSPMCFLNFGAILVQECRTPFSTAWVDPDSLAHDPLDGKCFDELIGSKDAEGIRLFLRAVVLRLGGSVVDMERFDSLVTNILSQAETFQQLLRMLHLQKERNATGVRMPGDSYGRRGVA